MMRTNSRTISTLRCLALTLALAPAAGAHAQVLYISSQRPQPFIPLNGGTSLFPGGAFDSALNVPVGFNFTYFGETFDTVSITENGAIALQPACSRLNPNVCEFDEFCNGLTCERSFFSGPGRSGFPSSIPPTRIIAPFYADIFYDFFTMPFSDVRYATVGAAPNRELVVEWRNMRTDAFGGGPAASRWTFQARLSENGGTIRFAYGPYTAGQDAQFIRGYIGIQSQFAAEVVNGASCTTSPNACTSINLQQLQNQVIEIGRPNAPELTGRVNIVAGAPPGGQAVVAVTAQNVGLQPTPVGFAADVYLSLTTPIVPGRDTLLGRLTFGALASGGSRTATLTAQVPGALAIGRYFVSAYVDPDLAVTEATEANNIVASSELMLVGADLAAAIVDVPSGAPGSAGTIAALIGNESSAVGAVSWRLYLSSDSALDGGDQELARGIAPAPSGQSTVNVAFTYPSAVPSFYQLLFVVDADGTLAEVDELNNVGASPAFVLGAELAASSVEAPARAGPGEAVEITALIDSIGSAVASVPFEIWLSTDLVFDPQRDTRIADEAGAVSAASLSRLTVTATVPGAVTPGAYHLVLWVDPDNTIPELDEGNNVWVDQATLPVTGPDISSTALSSAPIAFRGQPFSVTATFENVGGQTVRDARYSFHLSANQLITVTDPAIYTGGPITLAPGQRTVVTSTATIRPDLPAGRYYVGVIADTDGAVTEQDEGNNIRRIITPVIVRDVAPDFLLTEIVTPAEAAAGERVTVQRLIENAGNAPGQGAYAVRLVPVGGPSEDGFELGRGMMSVLAGATQPGVDVVRVPPNVPEGDYELEYALDPDGRVDELVEDNNVRRAPELVHVAGAQLEVVTKILPLGALGVPYDVTLVAQGGVGAWMWRVVSGALPPGLTLAAGGRITGTPAAEAHAQFVVEVTDGATFSRRALEILVVAGQAELSLITRALPAAYAGQPYAYPLVAVGGVPPYTWSYEGELAAGFVLTSSGAIEGVAESASPSRVLTFAVTDARGDRVERPLAFRVLDGTEGVRFGDGALPDGVVGESYMATLGVSGGEAPFTFDVGAGALPPGLTLSGAVVAGRPETAGVFAVELRVTDARGNVDLAQFVIEVSASGELRFVTSGLPAGVVGQPYEDEGDQTVQLRVLAPAGSSSVTVSVVGGALPGGLSMTATGQIVGTPAARGVFAFTAAAVDGEGRRATAAYGIAVTVIETIEPTPTDDGGCGCATAGGASGGGAWAAWALGFVALAAWRRRAAALLGVVVLAAVSSGAHAQRPPIPPPPGFDGGVGADGGTVGSSRYFTSTRTEPYQARSGGTRLTFPGIDDSATLVNLPFPFRLYEDDYTTVSVGTNGLVSFLNDASSLGNDVFPGQFEPNAVVAAFWDDLYNPQVTTYVEGTAPQRTFVIQYEHVERCCGGGQAFLDFQIQLSEGPAGRIELHYGAVTGPGTSLFDASIGLEDASGTRGINLMPCTPSCTQADFAGLGGTVLVALQDAGEDVFATALVPSLTGIGRVYPGVPFTVHAQYSSYHGQPIGPFVYRVQLASRAGALGEVVYTSAPLTLSSYEVRDDELEVTLPLSVAPGRYRLALVVDAEDAVAEPDESNNVTIAAQEIVVAEPAPNFVARDVTWLGASPAAPGAAGTVRAELANAGNQDGVSSYRVVLSGNAVASVDDLTLATGMVNLPLLTSQMVEVPVTLPAVLRGGEYRVGVIMDPEDAVPELSEVDNGAVSEGLQVQSGPLLITTMSLPPAYRGLDYAAPLEADGIAVEEWSVTAGNLPAGLTLSTGGFIFGRPLAVGSETFTVRVRARDGDTATAQLTLEVRDGAGPLVIVTRQLLPGVVGQAYPPTAAGVPLDQQQHVLASGGDGSVTFRLVSGAPEGLALDADGYLHGTTDRRGTYTLEIEATSGAETAAASLELTVVDAGRLTLVPVALAPAKVGEAYRAALVTVGAVEPAQVEVTLVDGAGMLPEGLALLSNGTITGTAASVGRFAFVARATEAVGTRVVTDTAGFELEVLPSGGFAVTPATLPDAAVGTAYRAVLEARLGRAPFLWATIDSRKLPRGLRAAVVVEAGVEKLEIAGTPEEIPTDAQIGDRTGGIATFRVSVTDAGGQLIEAAYAIRVVAAAPSPPPTPEEGGCSCASAPPRAELALLCLGLLATHAARRRRGRA